MPQDIFISYSSKDKEKADQLTELLASAGLSVWIDQSGIDVATSWSGEIVDAIEGCKAFVVLLSPSSIISENVVKEVSLAAEQKKKILPLDLEPVELPRDLKYHLAGIQRAPMTSIDAIIRALGKLGLKATSAPSLKLVKETDARKSLMILPFEDLSPTADNQWFADGIVTELIGALSEVKALKLMDAQATKEFKSYKGHLTVYAHEMSVRYFIQGSVRKMGESIKIMTQLLDIESGDYLWQDSLKGTMEDIFDIQETVAKKVVGGLNIILTKEEEKKLLDRGTENAEAYELGIQAKEYFHRQTLEGFRHAIALTSDAIRLDPGYAGAYKFKGSALAQIYRNYDRDPKLLVEAEELVQKALRLKPDLWHAYSALSTIYQLQGKLEEAERTARLYIEKAPDHYDAHFSLGYFYLNTLQFAKAISPYEQGVRIKPDDTSALWNLVIACQSAKNPEKLVYWASDAIGKFERYLKLHPDDESNRVQHAALLKFSGRIEEALDAARSLDTIRDGVSLNNAACLWLDLGDAEMGLKTFRKSIEAGYRNMEALKSLLEDDLFVPFIGRPDFEEVKQMVEKIEAEQSATADKKGAAKENG